MEISFVRALATPLRTLSQCLSFAYFFVNTIKQIVEGTEHICIRFAVSVFFSNSFFIIIIGAGFVFDKTNICTVTQFQQPVQIKEVETDIKIRSSIFEMFVIDEKQSERRIRRDEKRNNMKSVQVFDFRVFFLFRDGTFVRTNVNR